MKKLFILSALVLIALMDSCRTKSPQANVTEEGDFLNSLTPQEISEARLTPEMLWKFGQAWRNTTLAGWQDHSLYGYPVRL